MNKIQGDFHKNFVRYITKVLPNLTVVDATSKQNAMEQEDQEYNLLEYYDAK